MRNLLQNHNFSALIEDSSEASCSFSPCSSKITETSSPCRKEAEIFKWFKQKGISEGHPDVII